MGRKSKEGEYEVSGGRGIIIAILVVLFLVSAAGFVWSFMKYRESKEQVDFLSTQEGQVKLAQEEVDELVKKVAQLIILPEDETPVVATVEDAASLAQSQAFYEGSQNGDKVLIYQQASKAILYSPERNVLVNVGPVFTEPVENVPVVNEDLITVDVRNGSVNSGAARVLADGLDQAKFDVINITAAANANYEQILVVNPNGLDVAELVNNLGASVVENLPEGEDSTNADLLIIYGESTS